MITFSKLGTFGKLGNQMFQYAATKAAALNSSSLFAIPIENQSLTNIFSLDCKTYSIKQNSLILNKMNSYTESIFNYDSRFEYINDNTDLSGYFQSEKYFKKYKEVIRKDFIFKKGIEEKTKKYIEEIKAKYSKEVVSLHVRRADYVGLQNYHPLCSIEYYKKSMSVYKNCIFIVFSDDISWCKANFIGDNFIFSDFQTAEEDLCLMSLCDHNIIANSSFSWWGAWLNNNQNKVVCAPEKWFGPAYSDKNTSDIYNENWIKL